MSKEKKYRTATLMIRVVDAEGKRRYCPPVYPTKGRLPKKGWARLDGREEQFPGSTYVLRYRSMSGTRVWESVGTDPDAAVAAQDDRNHILRKEDRGELPPPVVPIPLPDPEAVEDDPDRKRLIESGDIWVKQARVRSSSRTGDVYEATMKAFRANCDAVYLDTITREDITEFLSALQAQGASPRTVYNHACHLRTFFRWAGFNDVVKGADMPRYTEKLVSAYSQDEVAKMRAVASDDERLLLDFLIATGFREQEVMFCGYDDVNFEERLLQVRQKPEYGFRVKDREERVILLPERLVARLKMRREKSEGSRLIFPTVNGTPNGHFLKVIKRLHLDAGLNCGHCWTKPRNGDEPKSCATQPVCRRAELHKTRKTYATMLAEQGVPVPTISQLLGHADLATTLRYLQASDLRSATMKGRVDACFSAFAD